ncbi:MAG: transaldolase [Candidatus Omnitrophota bacterium]
MPRDVIRDLLKYGQSVWLDNISRKLLDSGELRGMIDKGVAGLTSNPTIFEKSIGAGSDYDALIADLASRGKSVFEIYDDLTVRDVRDAAGLFMEVYEETCGGDGYVSLEVNPDLAESAGDTVVECKRLAAKVDRKNVMFKIPATDAGFEAARELLAQGININLTLIFSAGQYVRAAETFLGGLGEYVAKGGRAGDVASVASVFVSRIDTAVDRMLGERAAKDPRGAALINSLKGRAAVSNSGVIYGRYCGIFSQDRFKRLERAGARPQRALWASTGTKDPAYSDIKYVTELIGKNTVNTVPDKTLYAFLDHGAVAEALTPDPGEAENILKDLSGVGIDVDSVCCILLKKGLDAFQESFRLLLKTIETKAGTLSRERVR